MSVGVKAGCFRSTQKVGHSPQCWTKEGLLEDIMRCRLSPHQEASFRQRELDMEDETAFQAKGTPYSKV